MEGIFKKQQQQSKQNHNKNEKKEKEYWTELEPDNFGFMGCDFTSPLQH